MRSRTEPKPYPLAPLVAGLARLISGVRVQWLGCQPDTRQRVYFANHTSHLDFVVLWAALPKEVRALTRPVAAQNYWGQSSLRRYLATTLFRAVLIARMAPSEKPNRLGVAAAQATLDRMLEALGQHSSLIVFPEGTRGTGEEVAPFKSGLYHLCLRKPGLEMVPVYLENLNRILPKGEVVPVPLLSRVTFGPPMYLLDNEPKKAFLERTREAVCKLRQS